MATIKITTVTFDPAPTSATDVLFKYKLHSDSIWINANGGVPIHVPITGVLTTPLQISGLENGLEYDVSAQTLCGSEEIIVQITTPTDGCPNIEDIDFIVIN